MPATVTAESVYLNFHHVIRPHIGEVCRTKGYTMLPSPLTSIYRAWYTPVITKRTATPVLGTPKPPEEKPIVAVSPATILHGDLIQEIEGVLTVNLGATILVASRSVPGDWHTVLPLEGRCSCPGNTHHGHCFHVRIAAQAMDYDQSTALPVCSVDGCTRSAKVGPRCCIHHGQWAMGEAL